MVIKRFVYEPPLSRDLSEMRVNGQHHPAPKGICMVGSSPVGGATCTPGTTPDNTGYSCYPTGYVPAVGACSLGTQPQAGCATGSFPNT